MALLLPSPSFAQDTPLLDLLAEIPPNVRGEIYLADHAAMREEIAPFVAMLPRNDLTRLAQSHSVLFPPPGFDTTSIFKLEDGAREALGFSIFDIDQLIGWGPLPSAPVVFTVGVDDFAIEDALIAREFEVSVHGNTSVYHRQDDYQMNLDRRAEEPFNGSIGMSQRFARKGDLVLHTRGWPTMRDLIDLDIGLDTDRDATAILEAAYTFDGVGALTFAYLMDEQPSAAPDLGVIAKELFDGKSDRKRAEPLRTEGLPPYLRFGLLLWQDGAKMTGAIALPFIRKDTAQAAMKLFNEKLLAAKTFSGKLPFTEYLPVARHFEIIETRHRNVLILAFQTKLDRSDPINLRSFNNTPLHRLMNLHFQRDIGQLIGR